MLLSCGAKVSFIPIEICNLKESTSRSAYKMDSSIFIKEQQLWQSHMHKALGPFLLRAPCLRVLLLWDNKFMAETLIEAFVEFVGKLIPALSEPLLTNFKNKWLPFREILTKQQPHEALRYVQSMSFVRTNPVPLNYVPESGMKAVKVNDTNESPPNRRLTIGRFMANGRDELESRVRETAILQGRARAAKGAEHDRHRRAEQDEVRRFCAPEEASGIRGFAEPAGAGGGNGPNLQEGLANNKAGLREKPRD